MRDCYVYLRDEIILIVALAQTKKGLTISTDHISKLNLHEPPAEIGNAVIAALDAYEENVAGFDDWKRNADPMLRALGYKSLATFERGASLVVVGEDQGQVTVVPTASGRGGFTALPLGAEKKVGLDAEQIGQAIFDGLARSIAKPPPQDLKTSVARGRRAAAVKNGKAAQYVPVSFGYKSSWLAVKGQKPEAVVNTLQLVGVQTVGWEEGIQLAQDSKTFVSPPVLGWIFVISHDLPHAGDTNWLTLLMNISKELGEVQYFGSNRISAYQAWARARKGRIIRAYATGDSETLIDVGRITPEECKVRHNMQGDEEDVVLEIAEKWSIDPSRLEEYVSAGDGLVGEWPRQIECP